LGLRFLPEGVQFPLAASGEKVTLVILMQPYYPPSPTEDDKVASNELCFHPPQIPVSRNHKVANFSVFAE
jgi:hypothetical protein